jgi:iron complex outermembrane receptor protein
MHPPIRAQGGCQVKFFARFAFCCVVAFAHGFASIQGAAAQDAPVSVDIPAQSLSQALKQLGRQTSLQLFFTPDLVAGKSAPAVQGTMAPRQALDALLKGSGLEYVPSGRGVTLQRAAPATQSEQQMPVVQVESEMGTDEQGGYGPVDGYIAQRSATAAKTDTPVLETPRSITVVPAEQMERQAAANIDEVLRYTAGIVSEYRGIDRSRTDLIVRGFQGAEFVFTDGMRAGNAGYGDFDVDPYGLERVEILKGPASILYGAGSPGGMVNVVSKRPTAERFAEAQLDAGNYEQAGGRFDLGGAVDENERLLFRLTGLMHDGDSQVDFTRERRVFLAPALTWKAGEATSLTLLAKYQQDEGPWATFFPAVGTVLPNPNGRIPSSRQIGEPDYPNGFERKFETLGYVLEHAFSETLLLRNSLRYNHFTFEGRDASGWGFDPLLNDGRTVLRGAWYGREEGDALTTDTSVQDVFALGATRHTLLLGIDYKASSISSRYGEAGAEPAWNLDLFNPVYGVAKFPSPDQILRDSIYEDQDQDLSQTGFYAQDQMKIGRWALTLGGRYDLAESKTADKLGATMIEDADRAFTTQAGVAYVFDSGLAPYASYAESFEPQGGVDFSGRQFDPTTGKQQEIGLKYQPPGSRSLFGLSLFEITRQNILTRDIDHPNFNVETGEVRSRGAEVQVQVDLSRNLYVAAAYSRIDAKITRSNDGDQGTRPGQVPESTASLWANYRLSGGFLDGFVLSAGVRHTGASFDYANAIKVPSFTLYDLGMRYDLKGAWSAMSLALSAKNVTDKTYVASCEGEFWCIYGPRRVVTGSVAYRW